MSDSETQASASPLNTRLNPFVGPRPLRGGEPLFGRERELNQLTNLVMAERIVLLHSPSGAGKTSLIYAGLIPRLEKRGFQVLPVIRVNQESWAGPATDESASEAGPNASVSGSQSPHSPSNRYLFSTLLSLEENLPEVDQLPLDELASVTLSDYLARRIQDATLLVFDQFEEILTLDLTDRLEKEAFFEQLGQVLANRNLYALFAMREDFVPALQPYLLPIPTRLTSTYRLDLLGKEAAHQVTQKTALKGGVTFTEQAAARLVEDLSMVRVQRPDGSLETQPGESIEPVQLQVVCFNLWEKLTPDQVEIDAASLEKSGDVDKSLAEYYALQVAAAALKLDLLEWPIRDWMEYALITYHGVRSQVLREPERSQGLENDAIQLLVDAHLVRAEARRGSTWYELTHDRLVNPIREDNAAWFSKHSLQEYYARQVAGVASQTGLPERSIREWMTVLITESGVRRNVPLEPERTQGLENRAIELLVETKMVRAAVRQGIRWVELTHDRLVKVILEDNATWFSTHGSLLQRQAAQWEGKERPDDLLLRGQTLMEGSSWAEENTEAMSSQERDFLKASRQAEELVITHQHLATEQRLRLEQQGHILIQQSQSLRRQLVRVFIFGFVMAMVITLVRNKAGSPLRTPAAPQGMLSYELARSVENATEILLSWDAVAQKWAVLSLGIDFIYMPIYATAIYAACLWSRFILQPRSRLLGGLGMILAWGAWLAVVFDFVENISLLFMLFNSPAEPWPLIAWFCALIKLGLICQGILYGFLALAIRMKTRHPQSKSV